MQVRQVPVTQLRESPSNPRQLFGDLSELADSIRAQGVLQPLVAREVGGGLELVFGHRRLRAAKLAGLREVPVIVKEMSDVEVLEQQLAENLNREDVHPLELCQGYEQLMKVGGLTGDEVARHLGISRSAVFTVLKLRDLLPEARKAFLAGRLSGAQAAVAVARVRGERQQLAALAAVEEAQRKAGGPLPLRAVQRLIQSRFMGERSRAEKRRRQEASPDVVRGRAMELLLTRAVELVQQQAHLSDEVLRLLVLALVDDEETGVRLSARRVTSKRLASTRPPALRAAVVEGVLWRWVQGPGAEKTVARVFGVSWAELEKTAQALLEAEGLFR